VAPKTPRWFKDEDRSSRFRFDRSTGRLTPPDRDGAAAAGEGLLLYASGDIIWERDLQRFMLDRPPEHPFRALRELWADGDLVFAQLETCFGEGRHDELPGKRISYLTDPRLVPHFTAGGFHLACQASNHTLDYGIAPSQFTKRALAERDIAVSGTGVDLAAARRPALVTSKGFEVALLSYATDDQETNAGPDRPGNAPFVRELVIEDVRAARERADIVLVSVHKGREFVGFPHPEHQADCRAVIDAGADVILGHHPHFMQGIEWRRGVDGRQGLIFYSLGSLLVDYEPHLSRFELELFRRSQRNNYVAAIRLDAAGVADLHLTPVRQTEDWSVRVETPEEAQHTWDLVEWTGHPVNHEALCQKFWWTSWPYLAIQYPGILLHLKRHPTQMAGPLRWLFREETMRLQWGAIFGRDMPGWLRGMRRRLRALFSAPKRAAKRLLKR
jgi:poly-gamma-glutamate capsule biosynthesis protein CapA/YwtB (metallophosphatase superfamily)